MTLAEELHSLREEIKDLRNVFIWHLPGWVHGVILHLTGHRVVQIIEVHPCSGGKDEVIGYEWTDEYPMKTLPLRKGPG